MKSKLEKTLTEKKLIVQEIEIGGKMLTLEHGRFAQQADSAILARYGDTMVFVTVVAANLERDLDYFPLSVEYMEKLYAGGKIKGSRWIKREGRPSDDEILRARLIDRSIRPLFPKSYKKDVQVISTVLSVDGENDPAILAIVAASAAIATSKIPWSGPVGALRIGTKDDNYFANPTDSQLELSEIDLVLSSGRENILMIEAGAGQISEGRILEALEFGQSEARRIIDGIDELVKKVGTKKDEIVEKDDDDKELVSLIDRKFGDQIDQWTIANASKESGGAGAAGSDLKQAIIEEVGIEKAASVPSALEKVVKKRLRAKILAGQRLDGRKHDEIRPLTAEVGILPRTHGSAVFQRGQTQVLTTTTLGSPTLGQLIESAEGEETKQYIHHYAMPPYSTGETGRVGSPSRREIGHGALAERALEPVIPKQDAFPYTIRVVSEVMSSNGSTSMASVCGSTLSLMDAGVPILAPVSGIAMGLIIEPSASSGQEDKVAILSDIMGIEDGNGDMDFKVAGTATGVTAIQLDVKTQSLTLEILTRALEQAKKGRMFILDTILEAIPSPRAKISKYAPKIIVVKVPTDRIGEIIGPGGRNIKKIMADTGSDIDIEDDGSVTISGVQEESVDKAKNWIEGMVREVKPGETYEGEVKRILQFGAFVEILPGKEGLVHISDLSDEFVSNPEEVVEIGQKVTVRVKEIDDLGRINLTMRQGDARKAMPEGAAGLQDRQGFSSRGRPVSGWGGGRGGFGGRGGRGADRGRGRGDRDRRGPNRGPSRAPHFPASRYLAPKKDRF